jgi:uncharacterized protein (DUF488 family)
VSAGPRLATVGVYGFDLQGFLAALENGGVELILDIRQRRGVRGPEYAWANSQRLQRALAEAGIGYEHRKELAPTTELRQLQYREDARQGVGKRSRAKLAEEYRRRYTQEILDQAEVEGLAASLGDDGRTAALLCVERDPEACHRSLVAERLATRHGFAVTHLKPG